jgi:hypothetical protein
VCRAVQAKRVQAKIVGLVQHHFFEDLRPGQQYFARVALVVGPEARLDKNLNLHSGERGPWGQNSYAYNTQKERPTISNELRRQMWATFYVNDDRPREGSLLENPCLGCLARGQKPEMLSPLLQNVEAAHVIADAKGGPHGEDPNEAWNFVPLCKECNRMMKTDNAVDWFYHKCNEGNENYMPLFEMLFRLWRGRQSQSYPAGAPPLPANLRWNPPTSKPKVSSCKAATLPAYDAYAFPTRAGDGVRRGVLPTRI